MKKFTLIILFFFIGKTAFSQTIEVIVTDTVHCKVESYQYLLTISFNGYIPNPRKAKFEKELNSNNYDYSFFSKNSVERYDGYITVKYRINFKSDKERSDFELNLNIEKQNFILNLMDMEVIYGEQEKVRLIKKLIKKGEKKANLIAKGTGTKLGDMINLKESFDPRDRKLVPDNKAVGNYNIKDLVIPNEKNKAEKSKTLLIKFETSQ